LNSRPSYILPLIVVSQFAGTSLWFAGNAILYRLTIELNPDQYIPGDITSSVQFGFITGTLIFSIFSIADRFHPSRIFFVCSLLAAAANLTIIWFGKDLSTLLALRFVTGFFLAGIYPVGMKIAADWYEKGLGIALSFLVGALVLGTAFPYLLQMGSYSLPWRKVLYITSAVAAAGGLLILLLVPEGPYRKRGSGLNPKALIHIFRVKDFRAAAVGYFGHMWELYTFWALLQSLLIFQQGPPLADYDVSLWSFIIIGVCALGCVGGGYLAQKIGSARVAFYALMTSGICCIAYAVFLEFSPVIFLPFMIIWGIAVVADSPQFSTLVAQTAPPEHKGTALTIVTCIGFGITIVSLRLIYSLIDLDAVDYLFMPLALGPIIGLRFLYRLLRKSPNN
jgi:MFS family permease